MTRMGTVAALAMLLVTPASRLSAAVSHLIEITQPICCDDERAVHLHHVTYHVFGPSGPGTEIAYTCDTGPVLFHPSAPGDTAAEEREELNLAKHWNIRVFVEDKTDPRDWKQRGTASAYVDTLRVTLDLRASEETLSVRRGRPGERELYEELVPATVECILDNATRSWPPVRRVRLEVLGSETDRRFARVYPITPARRRG